MQSNPNVAPATSVVNPAFTLKAPGSDGLDFERPEAGPQAAVLVALIDLGTQRDDFGDRQRQVRKVLLAFELAERRRDGTAFVVARDYTLSLGRKAALRKMVEGWRGAALAEDEEVRLAEWLGKPCLLTLVEHTTSSDKIVVKVDGVGRLPKGMVALTPSRAPLAWSIAGPRCALPELAWVPYLYGQPVGDVIKRSAEWRGEAATAAGVRDG
jgi:hypothetical protein